MESRKDQLQKQIIEALKANDNDLSVLLKSQWAHRFGVESLEELKNLDLTFANKNTTIEDNVKNDQLENNFSEADKEISVKHDDNKEKEITNETNKVVKSGDVENQEKFEIKSYEIIDNKNHEKQVIKPTREYKSPPTVEALIPLPPKPKYSFLRKWLLRS